MPKFINEIAHFCSLEQSIFNKIGVIFAKFPDFLKILDFFLRANSADPDQRALLRAL